MCGRYALGVNPDVLQQIQVDYPAINIVRWIARENHRARFNVAPRSNAPVVRQERDDNHEVVLHTMQWGVIPHWNKHAPGSGPMNTINARCEAVRDESNGLWKSLRSKKRCLVPADGYYEWLKKGTSKTPYFMKHPDGKCMLLAGLWDSVTYEDANEPLYTFTIITTDSSKDMSFLHDRMPVILSNEEELSTWLDSSLEWSDEKLGKLLRPYEGKLDYYPVPSEVGNVKNDSSTFIQPVAQRADGISAMFKKQEAKQSSPAKREEGSKASVAEAIAVSPPSTSQPKTRAKRARSPPASHVLEINTDDLERQEEEAEPSTKRRKGVKATETTPNKKGKTWKSKATPIKKGKEEAGAMPKITSFFGKTAQ